MNARKQKVKLDRTKEKEVKLTHTVSWLSLPTATLCSTCAHHIHEHVMSVQGRFQEEPSVAKLQHEAGGKVKKKLLELVFIVYILSSSFESVYWCVCAS